MSETPPDNTFTTRFVLIRHGESNVMVEGVVGGLNTCSGLSARGKEQAACLGERLASGNETSFDVVYSSPLPRAIETTEILLSIVQVRGVYRPLSSLFCHLITYLRSPLPRPML